MKQKGSKSENPGVVRLWFKFGESRKALLDTPAQDTHDEQQGAAAQNGHPNLKSTTSLGVAVEEPNQIRTRGACPDNSNSARGFTDRRRQYKSPECHAGKRYPVILQENRDVGQLHEQKKTEGFSRIWPRRRNRSVNCLEKPPTSVAFDAISSNEVLQAIPSQGKAYYPTS